MRNKLLKGILTTAFALTAVTGMSKMEAKAMTIEEYSKYVMNLPAASVKASPDLMEEYENWKNISLKDVMSDAVPSQDISFVPVTPVSNITGVAVSHLEMLALVNADRAVNGAGNLAWNTNLEVVAQQRAVAVLRNYQSVEMVNAIASGDYEKQCAVVHNGAQYTENAECIPVGNIYNAEFVNSEWIRSAGHHDSRITNEYTQYACASYVDPVTNQEVWVEVFSSGAPATNTSTFDYIRYAIDYPDLAAVFGQNSTALYNHYITSGAAEGRKAYYTNGTQIR